MRSLLLLPLLVTSLALAADLPPVDKLPSTKELPDPFAFLDGSRVKAKEDWSRRRAELLAIIQFYEYGQLPPNPGNTEGVEIISSGSKPGGVDAIHRQFRLTAGPEGKKISWTLDLMIPKQAKGALPVILRGDWCWSKTAEDITAAVLKRGYILADFNRCEIAPDNKNRNVGIFTIWPEADCGSVIAWAWGFHRCVDFLTTLDYVDKAKIVVTGHSRGGKAAIVAGATDERIALTAPNNSGCGGAGSYKFQAPKSEDAAAITKNFPYWFHARFQEFIGKQDRMPLDQHFVKALIAPRALLTTEALGDLWANPEGSRQSHLAAKEVYKFLGAAEKIGTFYREGKHDHTFDDWQVLLDFADQVLMGKKSERNFDPNPFPETPKTFSWTAPG